MVEKQIASSRSAGNHDEDIVDVKVSIVAISNLKVSFIFNFAKRPTEEMREGRRPLRVKEAVELRDEKQKRNPLKSIHAELTKRRKIPMTKIQLLLGKESR